MSWHKIDDFEGINAGMELININKISIFDLFIIIHIVCSVWLFI